MWHDRRPNAPSPTPRTNTSSPLPRRTANLAPGPLPPRPVPLPRSSSLSLASSPSASTVSLPTNVRAANGSALRHELRLEPVAGVRDPLEVLEGILGTKIQSKPGSELEIPEGIDDDIDFGNLSLEEYANGSSFEKQAAKTGSHIKFDGERSKYEELHNSIAACDQVLKSVETYLTGFQSDLGAVSTEIESLQSRSSAMNSKLENRRVVEKLLGPAVEDLSLSPAVVRKVADGIMDEGWMRALAELEKRSKTVQSRLKDPKKVKALDDLIPLLESLTNKAVERIRDHLVLQIKSLRSPNINAQIIQQQGFLKFKDAYNFLAAHQPQLAGEICQAYINTMRWYYQSHFIRYETALRTLKLHTIDKSDLLGTIDDPSIRRGPRQPPTHDAFSIGRRSDVLKNPSSAAISSFVAEEDKSTHHLEAIFRTFNLVIVSNASFEYTFLTNFFSPALSFSTITRAFEGIFGSTFKLGQDLTKSLVENTTDALGILLCVRLTQHFAFDFQRLKVPPGEYYTNATSMILWPRLQIIMDMHAESLRKVAATTQQSTAPHPITQRFASLLQGILAISQESGDDEPLARSLGRVRSEYEACVTRLGKGITEQRKRERFAFNNYSLVGTILEGQSGKMAEENRKHFADLRKAFGAELK